jgi:hypothetical protein
MVVLIWLTLMKWMTIKWMTMRPRAHERLGGAALKCRAWSQTGDATACGYPRLGILRRATRLGEPSSMEIHDLDSQAATDGGGASANWE